MGHKEEKGNLRIELARNLLKAKHKGNYVELLAGDFLLANKKITFNYEADKSALVAYFWGFDLITMS